MTRPRPDLDLDLDLNLEWDLEWDLELDNKSHISPDYEDTRKRYSNLRRLGKS